MMMMNSIVIVKIGGSACTMKEQYETFNDDVMTKVCENIQDLLSTTTIKPVVIHGAGSFGHFQAKEYQVSSGSSTGIVSSRLAKGVALTRQSVTKLNHMILSKFINRLDEHHVVSLSPFDTITLLNKTIMSESMSFVERINEIFARDMIPLIHGDVCFDQAIGCSILSGDTIVDWLSKSFTGRCTHAVFLTDVAGVYTKPPSENSNGSDAPELIDTVQMSQSSGAMKILVSSSSLHESSREVTLTTNSRSHDVTGGILNKINIACKIARENHIPVYIVQAGTEYASQALKGLKPTIGTTIICVE